MKQETKCILNEFDISCDEEIQLNGRYKVFEDYLKQTISGEGMVGDNNYLILWEKSEIEELNDEYESKEFLSDIILIGSNGGDMAYGIDANGRYIEVPFIPASNEPSGCLQTFGDCREGLPQLCCVQFWCPVACCGVFD